METRLGWVWEWTRYPRQELRISKQGRDLVPGTFATKQGNEKFQVP